MSILILYSVIYFLIIPVSLSTIVVVTLFEYQEHIIYRSRYLKVKKIKFVQFLRKLKPKIRKGYTYEQIMEIKK